jgi:ABC-type uncharacterized transport system involved in gliding motility auxiliary subunit
MTAQRERASKLIYSGLGAAILAGILLSVNFIISYLPVRLDLSEGKIYSLTTGSKKILSQLDDNMIVKVAFSRNLPPPYSLNEKYVHNLLAEYRRASHGHIKLEFVDPSVSDAAKNEIMAAGVMPAHLDVRQKDRRELKECFMGLVFMYQNRRETLPFIQDVQGLEYEITQRIKKLVNPVRPKVGFVSNGNALLISSNEMKTVGEFAAQLYDVQTVDLSTTVPADLKAMWLVGPQIKLDEAAVARLKDWVAGGGTLGLLIDQYRVRIEQFQPTTSDTGLAPLLKEWGVDFKQGVVFDEQSDRIQIQSQQGYFRMINVIDYPYFPLVTDLSRDNPATKDLDAISLPFVSPLVVEKKVDGLTYTSLARTSKRSWMNPMPSQVSPVAPLSKPDGAIDGPFDVGLLIEGKFKPNDPNAKAGRVIVFGCSRFVRSDYPLRQTNYAAFMNLLDWSAQDDVLLSIRSKASPRRPLREMGNAGRALVKILMTLFLPIVVVMIGLAVWAWQRVRRKQLPALYRDA